MELTEKELKAIAAFEEARPGLGAVAEQNILHPNSGWREIIAETPESEIVAHEGHSSNNGFMYRHIGH